MTVLAWIIFVVTAIDFILAIAGCFDDFILGLIPLIPAALRLVFFVFYLFVTPGVAIVWLAWVILILGILVTISCICNDERRFHAFLQIPEVVFFVILLFF